MNSSSCARVTDRVIGESHKGLRDAAWQETVGHTEHTKGHYEVMGWPA